MARKKIRAILSALLILCLCVSFMGCQSQEGALYVDAEEASQRAEEEAAWLEDEESRLAAEEARRKAEERARKQAEEEAKQAEMHERNKTKVVALLERAPAFYGLSLTIPYAVSRTFHEGQYEWTIEPYNNSDTVYIVTCAGNYSPNPYAAPYLSQYGSISWAVDLTAGSVQVYNDPSNISGTFFVLAYP